MGFYIIRHDAFADAANAIAADAVVSAFFAACAAVARRIEQRFAAIALFGEHVFIAVPIIRFTCTELTYAGVANRGHHVLVVGRFANTANFAAVVQIAGRMNRTNVVTDELKAFNFMAELLEMPERMHKKTWDCRSNPESEISTRTGIVQHGE